MRRRVYAFILMVLTLIALVCVGVPSLNQNKNLGMDYKGGFEILYEITPKEGSGIEPSKIAKAAAEGISKRLEIADAPGSNVQIEGNNFIRVGVITSSMNEANEIKEVIEKNSEISFRDTENNLLALGKDILKEEAASVSETPNIYGYYSINLNISDVDLLEYITSQILNSDASKKNLVIWLGYEEGDLYENKDTDTTIQNKIIYDAEVSEVLRSEVIIVSGAFDRVKATQTAALINSGTFNFNMEYRQITEVDPTLGLEAYNRTILAGAIALFVIVVALIVIYRRAGVISSLSLLFTTFLTLVLFNLTNGVYSISSVAALVVGIALAIDAIVVILERTKKELYLGKPLDKAYQEGYRKAVPTIIDANVATLIVGIVIFLVGGVTLKTFASMLLVAIVSVMVGIFLINHSLLTVFSKTPFVKKMIDFGAKEKYLKEEVKEENTNKDVTKHSKKYLISFASIVGVALVVALVFNFGLKKNYFNLGLEFKEGSVISVETTTNYFVDENKVKEFLLKDGIEIEADKIEFSTIEDENTGITSYIVKLEFDENVTAKRVAIDEELEVIFGENTELETNYKLYIQATSSESTFVVVKNAALAALIASSAVAIYLTFRYRYTYALSAFVTIIHNLLITVAFFAIFRIKVTPAFVPALLAIVSYSVNLMVVIFGRVKEFLSSKNKVYISNLERRTALNNALNASLSRFIISGVLATLLLLVLIIASPTASVSFNLALLIGLVFASIASYLVAPYFLLLFERRKDKKERTFKPKKEYKFFKEVEERTFIGIND